MRGESTKQIISLNKITDYKEPYQTLFEIYDKVLYNIKG